jgi:ABC-type branched-subunit amino acid transport system permease subunit
MWAFGLGLTTYAIARLVLDGKPHPFHWLAGLAGGLVGVGVGWAWFRWRGDVF